MTACEVPGCDREATGREVQRSGDIVAVCGLPHIYSGDEPHHRGRFVWKNGAELVWECDDDCTHSAHEHEGR